MEEKLGRPLAANEQVHHIDGDYTNNSIENLEVLLLGEHQKQHTESICKYKDVEKECACCHQKFIWRVSAQKNFYANVKRGNLKQALIAVVDVREKVVHWQTEHLHRNVMCECP